MPLPILTEHQRQYCVWRLTRRTADDSIKSLAPTLIDQRQQQVQEVTLLKVEWVLQ